MASSKLSKRGLQRLATLWDPSPPFTGHYYDEEKNPDGIIRVDNAENLLMTPILLKYIKEHFRLTEEHTKYRSGLIGSFEPTLAEALPRFLNRSLKPHIPITREMTVVGPGVGGTLAQLLWVLCDPGDGVVMSSPYYGTYSRDIVYPAQAVPVVAPVSVDIDSLSLAVLPILRQTIKEQSAIRKVSVLILCNPHNPIGKAYPEETMLGYAAIAEEFDLHLVVDEVFANQVFASRYSPNPTPFKSILSFDPTTLRCDPARIHVFGGPTKDFGASGIKVGCLVSQKNPSVIKCVRDALLALPVSSAADAIFTPILNDEAFCDEFLAENRVRLGRAFELLADWCQFHNFPFSTTEAGLFCLVDFASAIGKITPQLLDIHEKVTYAIDRLREGGVAMSGSNQVLTRLRVVFCFPEKLMKLIFFRIEKVFDLPHLWDEDPWHEPSPSVEC